MDSVTAAAREKDAERMMEITVHLEKGHMISIVRAEDRSQILAYCDTGESELACHQLLGDPYPPGSCVDPDTSKPWSLTWDADDTYVALLRSDYDE